nr:glutamic acid-rich protein-like [Tanacetum cinerariifolium]
MGYEKPSTKLTFYKAFFSSQWKFLIHTILQCMSAKRTSWNEFSSSMASAVICLSSGRKFNFSKYIFDSLVGNVDSPTNFYMYPCFLQCMIRKQVGDLSTHTVGNKMHKAFPLPVIEFPLAEEVPTASEESCHFQKKREATTVKIALLLKSRRNCLSKTVMLSSRSCSKEHQVVSELGEKL